MGYWVIPITHIFIVFVSTTAPTVGWLFHYDNKICMVTVSGYFLVLPMQNKIQRKFLLPIVVVTSFFLSGCDDASNAIKIKLAHPQQIIKVAVQSTLGEPNAILSTALVNPEHGARDCHPNIEPTKGVL